ETGLRGDLCEGARRERRRLRAAGRSADLAHARALADAVWSWTVSDRRERIPHAFVAEDAIRAGTDDVPPLHGYSSARSRHALTMHSTLEKHGVAGSPRDVALCVRSDPWGGLLRPRASGPEGRGK